MDRTFKHINDCWRALEECTSLAEAEMTIEEFPRKFGSWYIEGNAGGGYTVTNSNPKDEFDTEKSDFDWGNIVLETDDLLINDIDAGLIKVDISVFDDFEKDVIIRILFSDDDDKIIREYKMVSEDDDGILMAAIR